MELNESRQFILIVFSIIPVSTLKEKKQVRWDNDVSLTFLMARLFFFYFIPELPVLCGFHRDVSNIWTYGSTDLRIYGP